MRRLLSFVVLMMVIATTNAQQDPQFTQWFNDKLSFNPATAGLNDSHCFSGFYRSQWVGFDTPDGSPDGFPEPNNPANVVNPRTGMFNYSTSLHPNFGLGFTFYNDRLGLETNNVFKLSGAYKTQLSGGTHFAGGLSLGFYQKRLGEEWIFIDPDDPNIPSGAQSDGVLDLGVGVYLHQPDKWYAGVSATHVSGGDMEQLNIGIQQHLFFMGGYNFQLNSDWKLRTNALGKWDTNKFAFDINANAMYMDMLYAGLSYRAGDAIAPMVGIEYCAGSSSKTQEKNQCFKLGYSYDVTTSDVSSYSSGSHEIFVSYCIKLVPKVIISKHSNPRFL